MGAIFNIPNIGGFLKLRSLVAPTPPPKMDLVPFIP